MNILNLKYDKSNLILIIDAKKLVKLMKQHAKMVNAFQDQVYAMVELIVLTAQMKALADVNYF